MELVVILADHGMVGAVGWCYRDGWGDLVRMIGGSGGRGSGAGIGPGGGGMSVSGLASGGAGSGGIWYHTRLNGEESKQGNIFIVIYFVFYFDMKNLIYFFVFPVFDVFCAGCKMYARASGCSTCICPHGM